MERLAEDEVRVALAEALVVELAPAVTWLSILETPLENCEAREVIALPMAPVPVGKMPVALALLVTEADGVLERWIEPDGKAVSHAAVYVAAAVPGIDSRETTSAVYEGTSHSSAA